MSKETQASKILRMLKTHPYVLNIDLNRIAYRYSARILELRNEGHSIQKEYVKPGVFRYFLKEEVK